MPNNMTSEDFHAVVGDVNTYWLGKPPYEAFTVAAEGEGTPRRKVLRRRGVYLTAVISLGEAARIVNRILGRAQKRREAEAAAPSEDPIVLAAKKPLKVLPPNPNDALKGRWVRVDTGHWVLVGSRYSVKWRAGGEFFLHSARDGAIAHYDLFRVAQASAEARHARRLRDFLGP